MGEQLHTAERTEARHGQPLRRAAVRDPLHRQHAARIGAAGCSAVAGRRKLHDDGARQRQGIEDQPAARPTAPFELSGCGAQLALSHGSELGGELLVHQADRAPG